MMGAIRLETFVPAARPETARALLTEAELEQARQDAYAQGVQAGADAATRAFQDQQLAQLGPIREALVDIAHDRVAAHHAVMASLRPLIEAMLAIVLPQAARAALPGLVAQAVCRALEHQPEGQVEIRVAPGQVAPLRAALSSQSGPRPHIVPDPGLPSDGASVRWAGGQDQIDPRAAIDAAASAVAAFFASTGTSDQQEASA